VVPDARKNDAVPTRKSDEGERKGHSARDRDTEWRPRDKGPKDERERTSSRGSKGSRTAHTRDHSRDDTIRKVGEGVDRGRSSEREKKSRNRNEDIDEDERDRRKMAEIVRRMEERAATKGSDVARKTAADTRKLDRMSEEKKVNELHKVSDNATMSTKTPIEIGDTLKKSVTIPQETTDMVQRTAAIQWASEAMADTNRVTQSTVGKSSSTRQKSVKIPVVKATATIAEDKESLEAQEFIAGQYPPVEDSVSSTVRLGRALVSGALGRRTDDPKIFGAAVNMTECSVRIQTTRKKAKAPVSAAPPNSIDSEADTKGMSDIQLSLLATDLSTQIDLPGGGTEMELQGIHMTKDAI